MLRKCAALIGGILVVAMVSNVRADTAYVLGADAGTQLGQMLKLAEPLAGDVRLSASIEGSFVTLTGQRGGKEVFKLKLIHPLDKDAKEEIGGGLAVPTHAIPAPWLQALKERLTSTKQVVHWKAIDKSRAPMNPGESDQERSALDLADVFAAIEHKLTVEDRGGAERMLASIPAAIDDWARVEVAFYWKRLGDDKRLNETLDAIDEEATKEHVALKLAKDIIRGRPVNFETTIKGQESSACDAVLAVNLLQRLENFSEARKIATAIRTMDPTCVPGWETEISLYLLLEEKKTAMKVADEAQQVLPKAEGLWQVLAYLYQESGELEKAVDLLDKAVRVGKPTGGSLRNLLGTVVRNSDNRQRYLDSYLARHRADPTDVISQMIAGVIMHYENRFEESDKLLAPLEDALGHSDRLHIYLAMNAFNRGDREHALDRLNKRADGPSPDPDVFYCRAEILRDTAREQARDDLERYRMMSEGRRFSNPDKDERIRELTALLDACIKDGREVCEGPWEHPRLRHRDNNVMWWNHPVFYALCFGVVLLIGGLVIRRRKKSEGA